MTGKVLIWTRVKRDKFPITGDYFFIILIYRKSPNKRRVSIKRRVSDKRRVPNKRRVTGGYDGMYGNLLI